MVPGAPKTRQNPSALIKPPPKPLPALPLPLPGAPSSQGLATGPPSRTDRYNPLGVAFLQLAHFAAWPMTSEQAAQLIDDTLDLVHQRLQELEAAEHQHDQKALAAEFREWRQPLGGHIDLMVCPGFPAA